MSRWLSFIALQQRKAQALSVAHVHRMHRLVLAWALHAKASAAVRSRAELLGRKVKHQKVVRAFNAWTMFAHMRKKEAWAMALAEKHHRRGLLYKCFWSWSRSTELAVQEQKQLESVQQIQRGVQVRGACKHNHAWIHDTHKHTGNCAWSVPYLCLALFSAVLRCFQL